MTTMYLTFVGVMAILVVISIYHAPKWVKPIAYGLFVLLLISAPLVYFDTLSRPKNLTDELRTDEQVQVLAYVSDDGIAVYYWLQLPGIREPRYYYEPWSDEAKKRVEQLQEYMENGALFAFPFERSYETEKKMHPLPQPKLEIKPEPSTKPVPQFQA